MRRRRLRRYVDRLQALQGQTLTRDQLLMKLGAARHEAGRAARLVQVTISEASATTPKTPAKTPKTTAKRPKADATTGGKKAASLEFKLDRAKLRQVRRREGRYLLRTNLDAQPPERLWTFYIQLTEVEQAFDCLSYCTPSYVIEYQGPSGPRRELTGFAQPWWRGTRRGRPGEWSTAHCGRPAWPRGSSAGSAAARLCA